MSHLNRINAIMRFARICYATANAYREQCVDFPDHPDWAHWARQCEGWHDHGRHFFQRIEGERTALAITGAAD